MDKRLILAAIFLRLGGGVVSQLFNRETVFILNYHRIRSTEAPLDTVFDEGVFGPDQVQLRKQLEFLQKNTTILSEQDLMKAIVGDLHAKGPYSMVTFDDAYIDNYQLALPILTEVGVPAIFFVPTLIVEKRTLGWWDQIAYIIKNSKKSEIDFLGNKMVLKDRKPLVIRYLQSVMKLEPHELTVDLLSNLARETDSPAPSRDLMDKELMSWNQLREANEAGITLGSHTCSHQVLATLNEDGQAKEIIESKEILEKKLGIEVHSLAFPVGGVEHFNETTLKLTEKAGYALAFSYNHGSARVGEFDRFNIPRFGAPCDFRSFEAMFHFPSLMDYSKSLQSIICKRIV